jgi:thiosulfate dehydrogenase
MGKRPVILVAALVVVLYVTVIAIGLRVRDLAINWPNASPLAARAWQSPHTIPSGALGESVRRGSLLFNETSLYAAQYSKAKLSCASCHAQGGIQPYASPMVGLPQLFPMFNARAGHIISLKDRIEECFVRSQNGKPLAYNAPEMLALVDYISWLSQPQPLRLPYIGRGLVRLPELTPNPAHGAEIYAAQCAGCHGSDGRGRLPMFPPLWGPDSFNDGAGMNGIPKMAAYVQHNMPQNRMGILSAQDAYDVAAFIHAQPRPTFNPAYKSF